MNQIDLLQQQLEFNETITEKLKPYYNRDIKDLPTDIISQLQKIKFGPKITSSGIEPVKSILESLYVANYYLETAISDPQKFLELHSNTPSKPIDKPIDATKIVMKTTPTNPNEKITINIGQEDTPKIIKKVPTNIAVKNNDVASKETSSPPPQITKIEL